MRLGQSLIIRSDGGRIFHNLKHGKQNGIFFVSFIMGIEVELKVGHLNRGRAGGDDGF